MAPGPVLGGVWDVSCGRCASAGGCRRRWWGTSEVWARSSVALGRPAVAAEPAEGPLHDPVGPDDLDASPWALEDTKLPAGRVGEMLCPGTAPVAGVGDHGEGAGPERRPPGCEGPRRLATRKSVRCARSRASGMGRCGATAAHGASARSPGRPRRTMLAPSTVAPCAAPPSRPTTHTASDGRHLPCSFPAPVRPA